MALAPKLNLVEGLRLVYMCLLHTMQLVCTVCMRVCVDVFDKR